MWLRSDKRELRIRVKEPQTKFLNNFRKKRKRVRNQYSKTIEKMKIEKTASVLSTSQYSAEDLTLYDAKIISDAKNQLCTYSKSTSEIQTVANMILQSKCAKPFPNRI